jgi:hypothetical protein
MLKYNPELLSQITQLKLRKRLRICNSELLCHSERSEELSEAFSQPVPTCRKAKRVIYCCAKYRAIQMFRGVYTEQRECAQHDKRNI